MQMNSIQKMLLNMGKKRAGQLESAVKDDIISTWKLYKWFLAGVLLVIMCVGISIVTLIAKFVF